VRRYRRLLDGADATDVLADVICRTHGHLPFAMHLWMGGQTVLPGSDGVQKEGSSKNTRPFEGLRVGLVATRRQRLDSKQPFQAVAKGMARLGCQVEIAKPGRWPCFRRPQLVIMWNGRLSLYRPITAGARADGLPMLIMEHGFFDRRAYTQVDHQGILHWASWVDQLSKPAPPEGERRLAQVWPRPLVPVRARTLGNVLVLGQVPGDSQMDESQISRPDDLVQVITKAMPKGLRPVFRPHPRQARRAAMPTGMRPSKAPTLADAVAEARFAVTVNSNAGNECLALGCPVLAFGPAVYLQAGVARQATVKTLAEDLMTMVEGWTPDPERVSNYLCWLACRQWNVKELAGGSVLACLLQKALQHREVSLHDTAPVRVHGI